MKFKKQTITVVRADGTRREHMPALVCNGVAVHAPLHSLGGWTVSHAASGMKVGHCATQKAARELAALFLDAATAAGMPMEMSDVQALQTWARENRAQFKAYGEARREYAFR